MKNNEKALSAVRIQHGSHDNIQIDIWADKISREYLEENIIFYLVNYEYHADDLKKRPHKKFFDMAVIFECVILQYDEKPVTAPVSNNVMQKFELTLEKIDKWAVQNTQKILKPCFQALTQVMKDFTMQYQDEYPSNINDSILEGCREVAYGDEKNLILYVLSNEFNIRGAACIIYENYLAEIAERLNCDFYICPSSIHETIIVPKNDFMNPFELREVIRDINSELVSDDEVLSSELLFYCLERNKLELWKEA